MKFWFPHEIDFWALIGIFMIFWVILVLVIFGILENKKIEEWKKKNTIYTELYQFKNFDKVSEKYICMKCILNPSFLEIYDR